MLVRRRLGVRRSALRCLRRAFPDKRHRIATPWAESYTARQAARTVLPNATETKIFVTANARAYRNFIEQRASRHAEPEIRKLANKVLAALQRESPNLFSDYERVPLPDVC